MNSTVTVINNTDHKADFSYDPDREYPEVFHLSVAGGSDIVVKRNGADVTSNTISIPPGIVTETDHIVIAVLAEPALEELVPALVFKPLGISVVNLGDGKSIGVIVTRFTEDAWEPIGVSDDGLVLVETDDEDV